MNYFDYTAGLQVSQELNHDKEAKASADTADFQVSQALQFVKETHDLVNKLGLKRLDYLTGFTEISENNTRTQINHSDSEILTEVEVLGLELNSTLVSLIMECSIQDVRYAIAVVEQTRKRETLRNPEGLFYRVLENKRKSYGFGF